MILEETYGLSDGVEIPKLGLGTWFIDNAKAASSVKESVKIGYRTAEVSLTRSRRGDRRVAQDDGA